MPLSPQPTQPNNSNNNLLLLLVGLSFFLGILIIFFYVLFLLKESKNSTTSENPTHAEPAKPQPDSTSSKPSNLSESYEETIKRKAGSISPQSKQREIPDIPDFSDVSNSEKPLSDSKNKELLQKTLGILRSFSPELPDLSPLDGLISEDARLDYIKAAKEIAKIRENQPPVLQTYAVKDFRQYNDPEAPDQIRYIAKGVMEFYDLNPQTPITSPPKFHFDFYVMTHLKPTKPTDKNPYGLIITKVIPLQDREEALDIWNKSEPVLD